MKKRWMAFVVLLCLLFHSMAWGEEAPALLFLSWGDTAVNQATQATAEQYVKSVRRRVNIQCYTMTSRDVYARWLAARWDAGTPGDVVMMDAEMLRAMARDSGGALRLMDVEAFPNELDLMQFSYMGLVGCEVDGRLCAVPIGVSSHIFFWHDTALELGKQKPPESEAELFELAGALLAQSGAFPLAASAEGRIAFMVTYLQSKYGKPWIDEKEKAVGFTLEEVAEGFRYLDSMERAHVWPRLAQQGDLLEGWAQGRYLGIWAWDSLAVSLNASLPKDGKMELTAYLSEWAPYSGGFQMVTRMLAIPEGAEAPKVSAKLIQFLVSEERGVKALAGAWGVLDSEIGAYQSRKFRLVEKISTSANEKAHSWARYPLPAGFTAPELAGAGGIYEQVLLGYSDGLMTDETAAAALMSGVKVALQ